MRSAVIAFALLCGPATALQVGDVVSLSSNGVTQTVVAFKRTPLRTVQLKLVALASNASEFCQRYEGITTLSPGYDDCVKSKVRLEPRLVTVHCRASTVIVQDGPGSGAYRRSDDGGPWKSTADENVIIHADSLFAKACARR